MKVSTTKGRLRQRERTRSALVAAAGALVARGVALTVEEAAREAGISRATAYRYFPSQDSLFLEIASIAPIFSPVEEAIGRMTETQPARRLGALVDLMTDSVFSNEALMRTALRVYMGQWMEARHRGQAPPVVRVGRRIAYMDWVLETLRKKCPKARWRQLRAALALTMGPEAMVTMKDVCGLSHREAKSVLQWAARALLDAGLKEMER